MPRGVQWFASVLAASGVTLVAAACGDDGSSPTPPPALEITARTPAPNATAVETGATVTVTFNQGIDPATLTAATFIVKTSGVALPVARTYDAATRTATATAPFLPGRSYEVEVTTGVRTLADSALGAAAVWSFATRAWQAVLVEATGFVGQWTSLAVDGSGRVNVSYQGATNGSLKYATCAAGCATVANWQTVTVDAAEFVGTWTSLALDAGGRVHVSYFDDLNDDVKYATCAAACATAANWQVVTADASGSVGYYTSLTVEGGGGLHVSYFDNTSFDLKYATCAAACTTATNWHAVTVDATGSVGAYTSQKVDGSGRVHVSYYDLTNADLKYATCAGACATAANWRTLTVDATGTVGWFTSLAVDAAGRVHLSYHDFTNTALKYIE